MTAITNNGTGTLLTGTLEGQLWELIVLHTKLQKSSTHNPTNAKYVGWSITDSGNVMSAQFEFPAIQTFASNGSPQFEAKEYLVNTGFLKSATEMQSTTPTKYLVELLFRLQQGESDPTKNPTGVNNVSAGFPQDTDVFSGSCSLNLTDAFDSSGNPAFPAKTYLL